MPTVLVIDDEPIIRMLYSAEFRRLGFAAEAFDGISEDVNAVLERLAPDIVILDIRLGEGMHGLDLLQKIRTRYPQLPVVLCTAYDCFRHDIKSIAADAYVVKSADISELVRTVQSLLQRQPSN
ncbi:MAG: two-component system response regulator [Desulfomicrobiaceae bacterium]|jgi:DNA-binding response OmpR family regulator|nr:two-component system response regulator [Desulfomicrobiaceae bacterium]